jgi:hypothetical protein
LPPTRTSPDPTPSAGGRRSRRRCAHGGSPRCSPYRSSTIGTLDIYNRRAGPLDPDQTADAQLLASLATLAVERPDNASGIDEVGVAVEPSAPWAHSAIVHNACGMVSVQLGISVDDALLRLRALAFVQGRSVTQLARAVVSRQLAIESWNLHD